MGFVRYSHWLVIIYLGFTPLCAQDGNPTQGSYGDELSFGVLIDKKFSLNPFQIRASLQKEILQLIYGYGLTKKSDKIINPPDLIARYLNDPANEGRIWHMILDRNINFHDGSNLRKSDVLFTFEFLKRHGGFILNRHFDVSNIKAITGNGDLELIFELYQADRQFGHKLADVPIVSANYYQEALTEGHSVFERKRPMGMGPFAFEFLAQNQLNLTFHPHYYSGRPFLNRVKIIFFQHEQELLDAFVNEEVDYMEMPDRSTALRIYELMRSKIIVFGIPRPETKLYVMLFNINEFPLSEPAVRQAINLAINRDNLVDRFVHKTGGQVANTLVKENNPYYERSLYREQYNPKQSLQILQAAGWRLNEQRRVLEKNGRPLSFRLYFARNSYLEENIARTLIIELSELNINVQPIPVMPGQRDSLVAAGRYPAMIYPFSYNSEYLFAAFEGFYFDLLGAGRPGSNYRNDYLTRLFGMARADVTLEKNVFQRFQTFSRKERPAMFLFFDELILVGVNNRFEDFRKIITLDNKPHYRMNAIENWFVPKDRQK